MSGNAGWIWSAQHNDCYLVTYGIQNEPQYHFASKVEWIQRDHDSYYCTVDASGQHTFHWRSQLPTAPSQQTPQQDPQQETQQETQQTTQQNYAPTEQGNVQLTIEATDVPPEPVPDHIRQALPNLMPGTPQNGWQETLDPSYRMRTNREAREFFVEGRVFSMLWAESASETWAREGTYNTAITVGRFGQGVYSQIRRFVVVKVKRNFVYAIGIFTYGDRGTLKHGCSPEEHSAVYFSGSAPRYYDGEREAGLTKEPIEIRPADQNDHMKPASRLRFGKQYPVEWNVKVKDIGMVISTHKPRLLRYWREHEGFDDMGLPGEEGDPVSPNSQEYTTRASRQPTHQYPGGDQTPRSAGNAGQNYQYQQQGYPAGAPYQQHAYQPQQQQQQQFQQQQMSPNYHQLQQGYGQQQGYPYPGGGGGGGRGQWPQQ